MEDKRILRIVVASPNDVQAERDVLPAVLDELNRGVAAQCNLRLELYRWETDAYPGLHPAGPQGLIDTVLKIEDSDILIGIFWKRFGTPTADAQSGTEHEILRACEAWRLNRRPQIMVYFNRKPYGPKTNEEVGQQERVLAFQRSFPKEGLWWEYHGKPEFERLVRNHLTQLIRNEFPCQEATAGRSTDELTKEYLAGLAGRVDKIYLFGEPEARALDKVFVELNIVAEYRRPVAHIELLGLMDAEMRQRRRLLEHSEDEDDEDERAPREPGQVGGQSKRTLRPDELLLRRAKAVVAGAPGCGKTTLLRYLAWRTHEARERLPVFLELKTVTMDALNQAQHDLARLLFAEGMAGPMALSELERARLKEYFMARLAAGEVAIFLDGLDEVSGTDLFPRLCAAVSEFVRRTHRHNTLVISTRPYALQSRLEGLKEMEIAPLSSEQIEELFAHYYGGDPSTEQLLRTLRQRHPLRELLRVPFLLAVITQVYRQQQPQIIEERLELYRQIIWQLVVQLDREKRIVRRDFRIPDPAGALKLDFLKHLACEQLLIDDIRAVAGGRETARLVFTGEVILEKAKRFWEITGRAAYSPYDLADDVKATPLLREVGTDLYAFTHLTLQEYLAAVALARRADCTETFCRAYFNPSQVELEVLPMTLGLVDNPNALYAALEQLPESLTLASLRLCARGLAYAPRIGAIHLTRLTDRLLHFVARPNYAARPATEESIYRKAVIRSFSTIAGSARAFVADRAAPLLQHAERAVRGDALELLGQLSGERAFEAAVEALEDKEDSVRRVAIEVLAQLGSEMAVTTLARALRSKDIQTQYAAAMALGRLGGARAVAVLVAALRGEDELLRKRAAEGLGRAEREQAVPALSEALRDRDTGVCRSAAEALGRIGGALATEVLIDALRDKEVSSKGSLVTALGEIGGDPAIQALVAELRDPILQYNAAEALGKIGGERALAALLAVLPELTGYELGAALYSLGQIGDGQAADALIPFLQSRRLDTRQYAVTALRLIGDPRAVEALTQFSLQDTNEHVRKGAADALGALGDERAVEALVDALGDQNYEVRGAAAAALGELGAERAVPPLADQLRNEKSGYARTAVLVALGKIGGERAVSELLAILRKKDDNLRGNVVYVLKRAGGQRALTALNDALEDEDQGVSLYAALALGAAGGKRAVQALLRAWPNGDGFKCSSAAEVLQQLEGETIAEGLAETLSNREPYLRKRAAQLIGYYSRDPQLLTRLSQMAAIDRAEEVRRVAGEALGSFKLKLGFFPRRGRA